LAAGRFRLLRRALLLRAGDTERKEENGERKRRARGEAHEGIAVHHSS
jgi:hypothetical protein